MKFPDVRNRFARGNRPNSPCIFQETVITQRRYRTPFLLLRGTYLVRTQKNRPGAGIYFKKKGHNSDAKQGIPQNKTPLKRGDKRATARGGNIRVNSRLVQKWHWDGRPYSKSEICNYEFGYNGSSPRRLHRHRTGAKFSAIFRVPFISLKTTPIRTGGRTQFSAGSRGRFSPFRWKLSQIFENRKKKPAQFQTTLWKTIPNFRPNFPKRPLCGR